MGNIGDILKRTREAKGLSLQQVEDETNMRWKYLEALEEENYDVIPGQAYVRGFLRNYAAFLGIEPEEMLEQYREDQEKSLPKQKTIEDKPQSKERSNRSNSPNRLIVGLVIGGVLLAGGWYAWGSLNSSNTKLPPDEPKVKTPQTETPIPKPAEVKPQPLPQPQPPEQPKPAVPTAQDVTVKLTAEGGQCWLAVFADGQKNYEGFINNGEVKTFKAQTKLSIRYGNAGVVSVEHQGKNLGKAGGLGLVVNKEYIK